MKKSNLYRAAQEIIPDNYLKERLAAKVTTPQDKAWVRVVGTIIATCMLIAVIGIPVMYGVFGSDEGGGTVPGIGGNYDAPAVSAAVTPSYYTREQLEQLDTAQYFTNVRQPHLQSEPLYDDYDTCDNTYYYLIDGKRVCSSCGYIFTEEQDKEIDLALSNGFDRNDEDIPDSSPDVAPSGDTASGELFLWPVPDNYMISASFGNRVHPIDGTIQFHNGLDISADTGTPVVTAKSGTIIEVGENDTDGLYIRMSHNDGYETFYAHLSGYAEGFAEGDAVPQGDVIGYVGSTGESTGPHLHFGILFGDDIYIDPVPLLSLNGDDPNAE